MVFNPLSGETHILDIVTGRVLEIVALESPSTAELRLEIAAFLEVDENGEVAEAVNKILLELEEVGLIEPVG